MGEVKKRLEKKQKKKKTAPALDEIDTHLQKYYDSLESPTLKHTLPYRFAVWLLFVAVNTPNIVKTLWTLTSKKKPIEASEETESEEEEERLQREAEERRRVKSAKNVADLNPKKIEKSDISTAVNYLPEKKTNENDAAKTSTSKNKEWSDKEKSDLIKAIAKFPAGTVNRWNRIAEMLERPVNECIQMEKSIKTNLTSALNTQLNAASWSNVQTKAVNVGDDPTISDKFVAEITNSESIGEKGSSSTVWSQEQQKLFEKALKEIGKDVPNRWDRIAESVPGKSKNDCILRYKELCATLAKKQ